jgi:hypothetical protein
MIHIIPIEATFGLIRLSYTAEERVTCGVHFVWTEVAPVQ